MKDSNLDIINRMIEHCEIVMSDVKDVDEKKFSQFRMLQDSMIYRLGLLGELANKLPDSFKISYQEIPWKMMTGLRHRVFHDYDSVNMSIVYEICTEIEEKLYSHLLEIKARSVLQ